MIYVAIGIHDPQGDYVSHAGAMLASLFSRTAEPVCVHVLHDATLNPTNKDKLRAIAGQFDKEIRFNQIVLPEVVRPLGGRVTEGALFRLLLPDLVQADKVIYFDCDIIVGMDILELWQQDLQGRPLAAAFDPGMPEFPEHVRQRVQATGVALDHYFNSGVLVMDLAVLRRDYQLYRQSVEFLLRFPDAVFHDQDALNSIFGQNYLPLDSRFNRIVLRAQRHEMQQPAVWHFAGMKPWDYYSSAQDMVYWKALQLTPWKDEVLDRLAGAMGRTIRKMNEMVSR